MTRSVKFIAIPPQALFDLFARETPAQGADKLTTGKVQFPGGSHRGYCEGKSHGGDDNSEQFHDEGDRRTAERSRGVNNKKQNKVNVYFPPSSLQTSQRREGRRERDTHTQGERERCGRCIFVDRYASELKKTHPEGLPPHAHTT